MHDIKPFIPELFNKPGTLLYVGARIDAHSWLNELIKIGHQITVLEVWKENVKELASILSVKVKQGDISRDEIEEFDYIVWWHGPEHLPQSELIDCLSYLESKCKLIALACPYGFYPQGSHNGNPYEEHKSTLYPTFFKLLGYNVKTDGEIDQPGSEIVAWKHV